MSIRFGRPDDGRKASVVFTRGRKIIGLALAASWLVALPASPSVAQVSPSGFKNAAKSCEALRAKMGAQAFRQAFGTNQNRSNAYGKCVSAKGQLPAEGLDLLIALGDRPGIRDWAAARTIATIDAAVAALSPETRARLAEVVLDTNATDEARDKMLRVIRSALAVRELGFYTEIWSYTFVELVPGGFFGTCNHLFLDPDAWSGLSDQDARAVLMHESFHSFDCVNGGPAGALDEGAAIWVFKAFFGEGLSPAETWAEAAYGTKLFYRDILDQADYPLQVAQNPTQKLLDVYQILSDWDPSQLPWNSQERLTSCFHSYFEQLNRNVDFFAVWLPAVQQATAAMLADASCRPLPA
jgi:hypothetical protein